MAITIGYALVADFLFSPQFTVAQHVMLNQRPVERDVQYIVANVESVPGSIRPHGDIVGRIASDRFNLRNIFATKSLFDSDDARQDLLAYDQRVLDQVQLA